MDHIGMINPSSHYDFLPRHLRKVRIQPREDEGKEALPPYSSAISLSNVLKRKMEFSNAAQRSPDRKWKRVLVTLQGTALKFYKPAPTKIFGTKSAGQNCATTLIRSYNLHHAQAGIAVDYYKKKHVIRIRAETEQFLLYCVKIETLVTWMQSLSAAIDLAAPLDVRDYPEDFCLPRRMRRFNVSTRQQRREEAISREAPRLSYISIAASRSLSRGQIARSGSHLHLGSCSRSSSNLRQTSNSRLDSNSPSRLTSRPRSSSVSNRGRRKSIFNLRLFSNHTTQPESLLSVIHPSSESQRNEISSFTQDGKWQPSHHWSPIYDMMYAKRCMAILTSYTPRKSNIVIVHGEFWVVDWVTGYMDRFHNVSPPKETVMDNSAETELKTDCHGELPPEYGEVRDAKETKFGE